MCHGLFPSFGSSCEPAGLLDAGYFEDSQRLAVALTLLVTGFVFVFQDLDLRAFGLLDDFGADAHFGKLVCAGGYFGTVHEQDRGEGHGRTWLTLDLLDLDEVTFGNLVLLSAGLDDRVHRRATPLSLNSVQAPASCRRNLIGLISSLAFRGRH